jgi:hypothetical protein
VSDFFLSNPVDGEVQTWVTDRIRAIVEHPVMVGWFGKQWHIKTEAPVLLPGDRQKRIDRVMIGKTSTVIVDYKTGEKSPQDKEQVEQYARVLGAMGYPDVQAYLVYLPSAEVVEVVRGATLNLFA